MLLSFIFITSSPKKAFSVSMVHTNFRKGNKNKAAALCHNAVRYYNVLFIKMDCFYLLEPEKLR